MSEPQIFERAINGTKHRVEVDASVWGRTVTWTADGVAVAEKKSGNNTIDLDGGESGTMVTKVSTYGRPRRVSWYAAADKAAAATGIGGRDLVPEPGSPAAKRDQLMRTKPTLYTLLNTAGAVVGILLPILLAYLATRLVIRLPWPDWNLPSIPLPDLPSIPWPDLPSIPWPDLAWWPPGWLEPVIDALRWVWPIALALVIARAEIRRRRQQDADPADPEVEERAAQEGQKPHPNQTKPSDPDHDN